MTLRYSWKKIYKKTGISSKHVFLAFRSMIARVPPRNKFDPMYRYYYEDFSGHSYMLNPWELEVYAFKYTPKELAQYVILASYRNYADYQMTKDASLDLFHSPISEEKIKLNKLLCIHDGNIHFYYEEDKQRRKELWH